MLRIAIVEDDAEQFRNTQKHLDNFLTARGMEYTIDAYGDGVDFLEKYKNPYDIVLMDIEMPQMSGMETAKRLRAIDQEAVLIFVTRIGKFAINGYEVSAIGYILKPINAYSLQMTMQKALKIVSQRADMKIVLQMKQGIVSFSATDLIYIEVSGHKLTYHLRDEAYETYGNLKTEEDRLLPYHFSRCSNAYLVNMAYVKGIIGNTAYLLPGTELRVSRGMKKTFTDAYIAYIGK